MTSTLLIPPAPPGAPPTDDHQPAPIDLDGHPDVVALLQTHGWGRLLPAETTSPAGRNAVWIGRTDRDEHLFVKRLLGPPSDIPRRMARLLAFQRFSERAFTADRWPAPTLLHADPTAGILVHRAVPDAVAAARHVVDETFTVELADRIGAALATVHGAEVPAADLADLEDAPLRFPSPELLEALPAGMFEGASFGELQAWRLLQGDTELHTAIDRLVHVEDAAPRVPIHADFRLDQVLVETTPDGAMRVLLVDWEEFRRGDAARDVGAYAGEWLYRSVLDIVTTRGGQRPIVTDLTHAEILRRGVDNLQRLIPFVESFARGYRRTRPDLDGDFADRATAFAGWHTMDRLLASSARLARITGIERAAAGIGRTALLHPDRFVAALGLQELT